MLGKYLKTEMYRVRYTVLFMSVILLLFSEQAFAGYGDCFYLHGSSTKTNGYDEAYCIRGSDHSLANGLEQGDQLTVRSNQSISTDKDGTDGYALKAASSADKVMMDI